MSDAIRILRLDHQKMGEILALFREELASIENGNQPDTDLLEAGLDYLVGYSDQCHHPKEELIYAKLIEREPSYQGTLIDLEHEHELLRCLTEDLSEWVERARVPDRKGNEQLAVALDQYLDFYRHHMEIEERHLFRLAPRILTDNDWGEIEFSVFDRQDPLLNSQVEKKYAILHERLKRHSTEHRIAVASRHRHSVALESATKLASVVAFNHSPLATESKAELQRITADRFCLVLKAHSIELDIPESDEGNAVRLALAFLLGLQMADRLSDSGNHT